MNKGQYCLSFCTVFTITLSILSILSVIESSPLIFLRLAELEIGEYDGVLSPVNVGPILNLGTYNHNLDDNVFLNFT